MYPFFETTDKRAQHPGEPRPAIVWFTVGALKLKDIGILAVGLPPGAVLRVVGRQRLDLETLSAYCAEHHLAIMQTNEDRVLTIYGCVAHYYADIQRAA